MDNGRGCRRVRRLGSCTERRELVEQVPVFSLQLLQQRRIVLGALRDHGEEAEHEVCGGVGQTGGSAGQQGAEASSQLHGGQANLIQSNKVTLSVNYSTEKSNGNHT